MGRLSRTGAAWIGTSLCACIMASGCGAGGPEGILRQQAYELFDCAHVSVEREGPTRTGPGIYRVEGCDGAARVACTDTVKKLGWRCQEPGEAEGAWAPILARREPCGGCYETKAGCVRHDDGAPGCGGPDGPEAGGAEPEACAPACCE